jgi:hypothetical protein
MVENVKGWLMMRKYIIGFIVGCSLMFAVQAGAATLINSTVDEVIEVEVDGENLGQAPVIDGVSYLPVRKLGAKAGYDVSFREGKATLTSKVTEQIPIETGDPVATDTPTHNFTFDNIDAAIKDKEGSIRVAIGLSIYAKGESPEEDAKWKAHISELEKELERLKEIKAEL